MINELVNQLRIEYSKIPFFTRVFIKDDNIYIWNDVDIQIVLCQDEMEELNNLESIQEFVLKSVEAFKKAIKKKYSCMKKKLSVIIPNYNNEIFIVKTINSILSTLHVKLEIIFVDDCSTDNSVEIVKKNFGNLSNVKIFVNKENRGTYYCRNKGLLMASGYYVAFVDGDDFISKEKYGYEIVNLERINKDGRFWGYGTSFQRLYYEGDINNIIDKKKSLNFSYIYYRKLFNYLGYFENNRFGADTELIMRGETYGFDFYRNNKKIFYFAYTTAGKNLTQIHGWDERKKYLEYCKNKIKNREYIEMALLENHDEFFEIIFVNNKKKIIDAFENILKPKIFYEKFW